jgi:hypothetical protein
MANGGPRVIYGRIAASLRFSAFFFQIVRLPVMVCASFRRCHGRLRFFQDPVGYYHNFGRAPLLRVSSSLRGQAYRLRFLFLRNIRRVRPLTCDALCVCLCVFFSRCRCEEPGQRQEIDWIEGGFCVESTAARGVEARTRHDGAPRDLYEPSHDQGRDAASFVVYEFHLSCLVGVSVGDLSSIGVCLLEEKGAEE